MQKWIKSVLNYDILDDWHKQASLSTMQAVLGFFAGLFASKIGDTDVQVPPKKKPNVGSSPYPKPLKTHKLNPDIVKGYSRFYHSGAPFYEGEFKNSTETIKVYTLETKEEQSYITAIGLMGIDFSLSFTFSVKEDGSIDVLVALPEHPSSLFYMMRFDTYAHNLIYQMVRGQLYKL